MSEAMHERIDDWIPGDWPALVIILHMIAEMRLVPVDQETTQDIKTSNPKNKGT